MQPVIIYIHGFNSSPQSFKAVQVKSYLDTHRPDIIFECHQMPAYPQQAWQFIESIVARHQGANIGFIGSSLGGFLSTKACEHFHCRAVLINPAVKPYELLVEYLGVNTNPYTQQSYVLTEQHITELRQLDVAHISRPSDIWALLQTADEVLDYRQAELKYQACRLTIEPGGDHSFVGFERHISDIVQFLAL
ncbi:esterase YqiA [Motilimonas pumila]|uniref:Esterase YqiA n=1 Tax=Motilimonas pumila TaxID=2303987 RepID=A0A418YAW0_9GAMM|nr:esterase YqiA [Motilimonas pumila]RJG40105.1 esterase YqiA [Motilimonas pumila]